jgi:hypothetical protein
VFRARKYSDRQPHLFEVNDINEHQFPPLVAFLLPPFTIVLSVLIRQWSFGSNRLATDSHMHLDQDR